MRYYLLLTVMLVLYHLNAEAQTTETIRARAGENIASIISPNGIYRFPAFSTGTYTRHNQQASSAVLNYNVLKSEMHYVNRAGDTLAIANTSEIDFFRVDGILFYYRDGYKEVIADYDSTVLAVEQSFKLEYESIGLYGQPNAAQEITQINSYNNGTINFQLTLSQDAVIRKKTTFYIIVKNRPPLIASKKNILKIFATRKAEIENYIHENRVNFNEQQDMKKLIAFCRRS